MIEIAATYKLHLNVKRRLYHNLFLCHSLDLRRQIDRALESGTYLFQRLASRVTLTEVLGQIRRGITPTVRRDAYV